MRDIKYYLSLPYTVTLLPDEQGDIVARIEELPGCSAHGGTPHEALDNLEEAKRLWIEDCLESNETVPAPVAREQLPSGKWLQRVPRTLHRKLIAAARRERVSLNQLVTSILSEAVGLRNAEGQGHAVTQAASELLDHHAWDLAEGRCESLWSISQRPRRPSTRMPAREILYWLTSKIPNRSSSRLDFSATDYEYEKEAIHQTR